MELVLYKVRLYLFYIEVLTNKSKLVIFADLKRRLGEFNFRIPTLEFSYISYSGP